MNRRSTYIYSKVATYLYRDGRSPLHAIPRIDRLPCSSQAIADKRRGVIDLFPCSFLQVKLVDDRIDSLVPLDGELGEQDHLLHCVRINAEVEVQLIVPLLDGPGSVVKVVSCHVRWSSVRTSVTWLPRCSPTTVAFPCLVVMAAIVGAFPPR